MFRATVVEQNDEVVLKLEGTLSGLFVQELESCWTTTQAKCGKRALVVDLSSITFVNAPGKDLLAKMYASGAKLVGRGPMTRSVVEEIVDTVSKSSVGGA